MKKLLFALLLLPTFLLGQENATTDQFSPLSFFLGKWESVSQGKPGNGQGDWEYTREVGGT